MQSKGLSRVFSNTTAQKHQFLTAIHYIFTKGTVVVIRDNMVHEAPNIYYLALQEKAKSLRIILSFKHALVHGAEMVW